MQVLRLPYKIESIGLIGFVLCSVRFGVCVCMCINNNSTEQMCVLQILLRMFLWMIPIATSSWEHFFYASLSSSLCQKKQQQQQSNKPATHISGNYSFALEKSEVIVVQGTSGPRKKNWFFYVGWQSKENWRKKEKTAVA